MKHRLTHRDLEQLEFYIADAVHEYGQEVTLAVMGALYRWCNRICPGYAVDFGVWPPPSPLP